MANIAAYLDQIKRALRGEAVRDSFINALHAIEEEGIGAASLNGYPATDFILKTEFFSNLFFDEIPIEFSQKAVTSNGLYYSLNQVNYVLDDINGEVVEEYVDDGTLVSNITVIGDKKELLTGETLQLLVDILPNDATNKRVTWSSSNEIVASVNRMGLVVANTPGNATIVAKTTDKSGLFNNYPLIVRNKIFVQSIRVTTDRGNNPIVGRNTGVVARAYAFFTPDNPDNASIQWISSDENILAIDENGYITKKLNNVIKDVEIYCISNDETKTESNHIIVKNRSAQDEEYISITNFNYREYYRSGNNIYYNENYNYSSSIIQIDRSYSSDNTLYFALVAELPYEFIEEFGTSLIDFEFKVYTEYFTYDSTNEEVATVGETMLDGNYIVAPLTIYDPGVIIADVYIKGRNSIVGSMRYEIMPIYIQYITIYDENHPYDSEIFVAPGDSIVIKSDIDPSNATIKTLEWNIDGNYNNMISYDSNYGESFQITINNTDTEPEIYAKSTDNNNNYVTSNTIRVRKLLADDFWIAADGYTRNDSYIYADSNEQIVIKAYISPSRLIEEVTWDIYDYQNYNGTLSYSYNQGTDSSEMIIDISSIEENDSISIYANIYSNSSYSVMYSNTIYIQKRLS